MLQVLPSPSLAPSSTTEARRAFFSDSSGVEGIEQHYSAVQVAGLLGRCPEYVVKLAKSGRLGPVFRDAGGWIIPASGVRAWLSSCRVTPNGVAHQ
jgi:hypothetical protein